MTSRSATSTAKNASCCVIGCSRRVVYLFEIRLHPQGARSRRRKRKGVPYAAPLGIPSVASDTGKRTSHPW